MKEEEVEEEMGEGIGEERVSSPPPPRCPTTWVVHPSTPEEKECFREQVCYKCTPLYSAFTEINTQLPQSEQATFYIFRVQESSSALKMTSQKTIILACVWM
jgi:hypothetical protein